MATEIVDFPMKDGDFPVRYVKLPEGSQIWTIPSLPNHLGYRKSLIPALRHFSIARAGVNDFHFVPIWLS